MFPKAHKPFDVIGVHLREAWAGVVTAPLPDSLRRLAETLSEAEKAARQQGTAAPVEGAADTARLARVRE
jgi:hypothetical protein